jgi:hypothetical protein
MQTVSEGKSGILETGERNGAEQYCTVMYCTVYYSTVKYSTVQRCCPRYDRYSELLELTVSWTQEENENCRSKSDLVLLLVQ